MYNRHLVKEKHALITGSSRGIGQKIALGLGRLGCNILLHARKVDNLKETRDLLKELPIDVYTYSGELSDESQLQDFISQVKRDHSTIDILYNNAAVMSEYKTNIWDFGWDEWVLGMKANVFAMYTLCGAFIPGMISNGYGRIINLTSGIKDTPQLMPYSVSKAAVDKLTQDIAAEIANTGVRINYLDPGWLQTDMGGPNAEHPVDAVLPGALAPALIENDGPNGEFFSAIFHDLDLSLD